MNSRLLVVTALAAAVVFAPGCGRRVQRTAKTETANASAAPAAPVREKPKPTEAKPPVAAAPATKPPVPEAKLSAAPASLVAELENERAAHIRTRNDLAAMTRKYTEASRELDQLRAASPTGAPGEKASATDVAQQKLLTLAKELYDGGTYDMARKVLSVMIDLGYKGGYGYFMLGQCYAEGGDVERAISYYKMACDFYEPVEPKPKYYLYALNNLGAILRQQGKLNEARAVYEQAESAAPDYAPVHYNLGMLYADYLNDKRRAIEHYQKYLDLNGERLAEVQERIQKLHDAIKKEEGR